MKTGAELIKLNIEKQGLIYFEIQSPKGATVAAQLDEMKPEQAADELENICEQLPPGRYTCILSKKCDKENARIKKGPAGTGYFELPLIITGQGQHVDINSHNASANNFKEIKELMQQIAALERQILKLEIENERLKDEGSNSGINGLLNNPNIQNAIAIMAANVLSQQPAKTP